MANGASLHISHISHSTIFGLNNHLLDLRNILHVPKINKHLLSAHKLASNNNVFIEIHPSAFFVMDKVMKKTFLFGRRNGGLCPVPIRHVVANAKVSPS